MWKLILDFGSISKITPINAPARCDNKYKIMEKPLVKKSVGN
jgi:hypothetical protein